jgi:hypothetical protein
MFTEPDFSLVKENMRWRYLDSLDSIRYSAKEFITKGAPIMQRVEQAKIEMIVTILMGNGIIVPNNQLMDSVGFMRNTSEIISEATKYSHRKKEVFVPIKWAKYDYPKDPKGGKLLANPFDLVAFLFDKANKQKPGYFELSAWHEVEARRREFAKFLRNPKKFPSDFVQNNHEAQLVNDLFSILTFFSENRSGSIIEAGGIAGIRESMSRSIADLSIEIIKKDGFFSKLLSQKGANSEERLMRLMDIISVFKLLKQNEIIDNRSQIRDDLQEKRDIYFTNINGFHDMVCEGVLKTFNSIYNFAGYISTNANQDNQTEPMHLDKDWGYDEAAFALGQWARENYEKTILGTKSKDGVSSLQDSYVEPQILSYTPNSDDLWSVFFDYERSMEWNTSIIQYINSLQTFRKAKYQFEQLPIDEKTPFLMGELEKVASEYKRDRNEHINKINKLIEEKMKGSIYHLEIENDEKALLLCKDPIDEKIISRIQIENFAEDAVLSEEEKCARYAGTIAADNITSKGRTKEFRI